MAKPTPDPAAAPVLDQEVEMAGDGKAARARFRWPKLSLKLPPAVERLRAKLPRIALSKKSLLIILGVLVGLGAAGTAAYLFRPADPEWPRAPVHKPKKAKKAKPAASAASDAGEAIAAASPASQASAPPTAAASTPQAVASGPEHPIDRLQRRLAEALGGGAKLESGAEGELRLTARGPSAASGARAGTGRGAAADRGDDGGGPLRVKPRAAMPSAAAQWSYGGDSGPEVWARLKPEFAKCGNGTRQSPIDLHDGIRVDLEPVRFDYKPSRFGVIDDGRTVQVNVAPGNFIEVMGRRYQLQEFHFHRPSEELIAGKRFDMDAHLVHRDGDGRLAIVAVLLERGGAQPIVQTVWNNLPLEKGEEQVAQTTIDLQQLLPAQRGYFTYMGSLTTPPCTEGVLWMVMKQPVAISAEQIDVFSRLYPMNARPVQPAGGRMVKESN